MGGKKIGIILAADGEREFTQALSNAKKESALLKSELNKLNAEYSGNVNSLDFLSQKQANLEKQTASYQKRVKSAKEGLENAQAVSKKAAKRYEELTDALKEAEEAQKEMQKAGQDGTKEYQAQSKEVEALQKAVEKQSLECQKCEGKITDWSKRIADAETDIEKNNQALKENAKYLEEAEKATDNCATSIDAMGKEVKQTEQSLEQFGDTADEVAQVTTTLGDKVVSAFVSKGTSLAVDALTKGVETVKESMYDASAASTKLAASTGLSESAMKKYNAVMKEIKGNNLGEDYSDISSVMAEIVQIMGKLDSSAMQEVTESAIALRDTFGMDVNEQIRAVDVMMKTMGVDATKAFDLITTGAQRGLNRSGELTDNLAEYAQLWGQAGFSAEEMFAILENGLDSGAYNLDKVNDFVKEFGISLADGKIEENISSFSDGTKILFEEWKNGNASSKDVFFSVISDLEKMENRQEALTIASETWSSLGEDNAMQVLTALNDVNDAYSDVKGSMESLKEVRYSDLESAVSGLGAALQEGIVTPIADKALPVVTGLFEKATEVVEGIGDAIAPQKTELEQFIEDIKLSNEEVQTVIDNAQATMDGATADVANLEAYKQVLMELNEQESLTEFQKYQLANAVEVLSGSVPGLAESFNAANGTLSITNEELANLFDNAEAVAMQTALIDAQKQSYEALAQAAINKAKADSAVATAQKESADASEKNLKSMQETGNAYGEFYREELDAQIALDDAVKAQKEANATYEEAQKQIDTETKALEDLNKQYGLIPNTSAEVSDSIKETGKTAGDVARTFDEYGNDITGMSEEQAAAVTEASQKIVDAYTDMRDGIADSIKGSMSLFDEFSGGAEISAGEINDNLESQITGIQQWSENMKTLAGQIGQGFSQELYDELAAMGPEQSATAVQALVDALNSESGEFEEVSKNWSELLALQDNAEAIANATTAGKNLVGGYVVGMTEESEQVVNTTQEMAQAAVVAAENEVPNFQTAGSNASQAYTNALKAAVGKASQAGGDMARAARNALNAYHSSFQSAGYNISAGVAVGIRNGQSNAVTAAANMARAALQAAKSELEIRSPSKKFRKEVGQNISESTAFGIKDKASLAGKAAKKMSNKVYTNAVSWLAKYKKSQQVSLADEKWYWQQVLAHTKAGTTAYNNALKKIQNITITELTASGVSSAAASKISDNFGVSKTTGSGKKKKKKDTETYYSEVYSAAEKYLSNQQVLNDWSLQQELAYWNAVKGQLKKGSQAWYDATKQINSLQADIAAAEAQAAEEKVKTHASVQKSILDSYKVYYKVSAKAEMDYWNIARQQFKVGTDERIEADHKYLEACQEFYDQRKELDEDYAESSQDINDQLADSVKELQDTYKDAVESRKQDILSSMNLFESWDASGYDSDTLLYNLKTQVAGLALWEQQLEELGRKGLSDALMEELSAMGPDAAANIYSLNQMTAEQLDEYNKLWEQKNALAHSQALKDNEDLLRETNSEIINLRTEAQAELNALNADYRAALQELNTGISSELRNLVNKAGNIGEDAVSSLIGSIGKAVTSVDTYNSTTSVVNAISDQLGTLKEEGEVIGASTLDGILAGLTDYNKIETSAQAVIQSIKKAMEEEAEIHSPSRLFRRETGPQIPAGVALGMEDGTEVAVKSAQEMMQDTLAAAQEEMRRQQATLQEQAGTLSYAGIAKLNRLTEQYPQQAPVVNVDNSGIVGIMQQFMAGMQEMVNEIKNLQMVTDTGVLAGVLQPKLSQENAAATVRRNRGQRR